MNFTLKRRKTAKETTIGMLYHENDFICYTLEDQVRDSGIKVFGKTAIPAGKYKVIITMSPRFKRELPLLIDVPGFDGIRIHPGNKKEDTEGCILPGLSVSDDQTMILQSRDAFNQLFTLMKKAKGTINITIMDSEE